MTATFVRYDLVDLLRGVAIAMMLVFHFCFELNDFGFVRFDFYHDPFWLNFRIVIVSTFLLLMGVSLFLATRKHFNKKAFLRRQAILVVYAGLVTLSTYLVKPEQMVFFGILHFIAVASPLGLLFTGFYRVNLLLGIGLIAIDRWVQHSFFDQPALRWFGLMTHKPITGDYVPLVPWFGVVLLGLFLGKYTFGRAEPLPVTQWQSNDRLTGTLALAGRYSVHIYMLHIPVFIGILSVISRIFNG